MEIKYYDGISYHVESYQFIDRDSFALLLQSFKQAEVNDEKGMFASIGGSVRPMTRCLELCASTGSSKLIPKMNLIIELSRRTISEIKLKRTDTTLDLSQKAKRAKEKRKGIGEGCCGVLYSRARAG